MEAAKSIAAATKSLVQSARATQRELVEQGKLSDSRVHSADSQWSDGLVSAVSNKPLLIESLFHCGLG